jgi:hypothetical protein
VCCSWNMARLEEVTIDTQGWKERRCEDSSKTGSVEEGRGKGKGSEEEERRRFKERRYETCFPTHLDRGLVSRPVSTGPSLAHRFSPASSSSHHSWEPNGRQQPPVIEPANYHHPCHWSCGPTLTIFRDHYDTQSCTHDSWNWREPTSLSALTFHLHVSTKHRQIAMRRLCCLPYADRHGPGVWHVQGVPTAKLVLHETVIESKKKAFTKVCSYYYSESSPRHERFSIT